MKKSTILLMTGVFALSLLAADMASALTVCHDFTLYKVTRADGNDLGRTALVERLKSQPKKYRNIFSFDSADAAKLAKGQRYLRAGDVVFLGGGNGHSGFMTPQGIEHFIQVPGEVGQARNPNNLPKGPTRAANANAPANVFGGHFAGDSLAGMLGRLATRNAQPVEIWSNTYDLRVTMTWNTRTDVDLWVEEPGNQKAWYRNRTTSNTGALLEDVTTGFGPEHYELARAEPGEYVIKVNYFSGPRNAKVEPTTVTIVVTKGDGAPQTFTATLNAKSETKIVHTVRFP